MKLIPLFAAAVCVTSLIACQQEEIVEVSSSPILVSVNGQNITQEDVSLATQKLFSRAGAAMLGKEVEQKALQSMVMMMAIAQESESKASAEELDVIDIKTRRYREELLTEIYLRKYADVLPPTASEMLYYYDSHKALFGEQAVKQVSIIRSASKPSEDKLAEVLGRFKTLKNREDWNAVEKEIQNSPKGFGSSLEFVNTSSDIPGLDKDLMRIINKLDAGETSNISYVDKKPHLIRVKKILQKHAAPYEQVKNRIRKTLAAQKLKQQIKKISAELVAKADVQYTKNK